MLSKEELKQRELGLARNIGNTKQVALNQDTLKPMYSGAPVNSKPQLKGGPVAQPQPQA
jgi:hypothetical protein